MKLIFTFSFLLYCSLAFSQNGAPHFYANTHTEDSSLTKIDLNGQWRGSFNDLSPDQYGLVSKIRTKYVLELKIDGMRVSGYSYTYFEGGLHKYYTICRITGTLDRKSNYLEITEVERIRYNTPPYWSNCFQTHRLQYQKGDGGTEYLVGNWVPAPGQTPGCGHGETLLERHSFNRAPFGIKPVSPEKKEGIVQQQQKKPSKSTPKISPKKDNKPEDKKPEIIDIPFPHQEPEVKMDPGMQPKKLQHPKVKGYEKRTNEISQTIYLSTPEFHIALYDNGEIDGDSISVFYNGRLILSNKRLSEKPISLTLHLDNNVKTNIITMYAENLGAIPPNTAVMVVTAGDRRYEIRLESDYGKSGSVVFKLKE